MSVYFRDHALTIVSILSTAVCFVILGFLLNIMSGQANRLNTEKDLTKGFAAYTAR